MATSARISYPSRVDFDGTSVDYRTRSLEFDRGMQQADVERRNRLLSCLCCWSYLSEFFFSLFSSREDPQNGGPTGRTASTTSATRSREEQRRLLSETPKLSTSRICSEELDLKQQLQIAGVPKFPGEEDTSISKTFSHISLGDLAEEICPTCLEVYTDVHPKIVTKCGHHFHLECIYAWLERSQTCPVCFKPMSFDELE